MTNEVKTIAERWLYDCQFYAPELITADFFYQWLIKNQPENHIADASKMFTIEQVEAVAREAHGIGAYRQQDFCAYWQQKKESLIKKGE